MRRWFCKTRKVLWRLYVIWKASGYYPRTANYQTVVQDTNQHLYFRSFCIYEAQISLFYYHLPPWKKTDNIEFPNFIIKANIFLCLKSFINGLRVRNFQDKPAWYWTIQYRIFFLISYKTLNQNGFLRLRLVKLLPCYTCINCILTISM